MKIRKSESGKLNYCRRGTFADDFGPRKFSFPPSTFSFEHRSRPRLDPTAQHLSNAPRLGDTTVGSPRLFRIEDLADRTDTVLIHVRDESTQKLVCAGAIFGINF